MPQPNGNLWRHCRAKMDITSDQAADLLGIAGGALRQIETYNKTVSLALAYRAERLYQVPVTELLVDGDEPPKPKPERPKPAEPKVEPTSPPPRRNGKGDRKGPRRADSLRAAS